MGRPSDSWGIVKVESGSEFSARVGGLHEQVVETEFLEGWRGGERAGGRVAAQGGAGDGDRSGPAGPRGRDGDAAGAGHGQLRRAHPAADWAGGADAAGASRVRPRHPVLRDRGVVRRVAADAGGGAEGNSARELCADVEGGNEQRRGSGGEIGRAAKELRHRLLRHHAAALAAYGDLGCGHRALAGRDHGGRGEEADQEPRSERAWAAGAAADAGQHVAGGGHDPDEPHRREHGRRGLRHAAGWAQWTKL